MKKLEDVRCRLESASAGDLEEMRECMLEVLEHVEEHAYQLKIVQQEIHKNATIQGLADMAQALASEGEPTEASDE